MKKTLITMTAASALVLGFGATAFAGNGNNSHNSNNSHNTANIGSSLLNIGGQGSGSQ